MDASEAKIRRTLQGRGLRMMKSRVRDPHALDYGKCWIVDIQRNAIVATLDSIEEVAEWLEE